MKIIILGCGEFGAKLAELFQQEGSDITVIDSNPDSLKKLGKNFTGKTVVGSGLDREVLEKPGIQGSDVFVACAGKDRSASAASASLREVAVRSR